MAAHGPTPPLPYATHHRYIALNLGLWTLSSPLSSHVYSYSLCLCHVAIGSGSGSE